MVNKVTENVSEMQSLISIMCKIKKLVQLNNL